MVNGAQKKKKAKEVMAAELKMKTLGRITSNSQSWCGETCQV